MKRKPTQTTVEAVVAKVLRKLDNEARRSAYREVSLRTSRFGSDCPSCGRRVIKKHIPDFDA